MKDEKYTTSMRDECLLVETLFQRSERKDRHMCREPALKKPAWESTIVVLRRQT